MSLQDIVNIVISLESVQVTRAGFGVPLILSAHDLFEDLVREYTALAGMVTDGFTSDTPEYKAAQAIFAQSPRPPKVKVGRRTTSIPTLKFTLTPTAKNSTTYRVTINGVDYEFTSDASATAAEIVSGLTALINGDSATDDIVTASGVNTLVLTADAAGVWFDLSADLALFSVANDHAAPAGLADDLSAIVLADNDWYALVSVFKSPAEIAAIAGWVEANKKLFCAATPNTDVIGSGSGDVATTLKTSAYARSWAFYHELPGQFADAAVLGKCLPFTPGSETWKFKTLAGITASALTPSQRSNALGKRAMVYTNIAGVNMTEEGVVAAGEFIDTVRFLDWVDSTMSADVFSLLARSQKVPFTDAGVAGVESIVRSVLRQGIAAGGFADDPEPTVSVPRVADVPLADKQARNLPDVRWTATLAGAIHSVKTINGVVSV